METEMRGLYVHIPFCLRKCNYCDFCSFKLDTVEWRDGYIGRLCKEIASYSDKKPKIDTIFFGGGTPSLLTPDEFRRICSEIRSSFDIQPDTEFTVEANPKTLSSDKLATFVQCGVNRLSIGLQSIHDNELKILGRIHNYDDFLKSYRLAQEFGIDNINIDLMYGIPEQTAESFGRTLVQVIGLSPRHISLYGLILEEGTPLFEARDRLIIPTEDEECDMYYLAANRLSSFGYSHYEISNYSKAGYECRHNLKYWRNEEYIGVGLGAHSYYLGKRFSNSYDVNEYLSGERAKYIDENTDQAYEFVMLTLRLREGFSLSEYKLRFGTDFSVGREDAIKQLSRLGYIKLSRDRLSLTERGFYVSNSILTELL